MAHGGTRRILRIGIIQNGQLIEERLLRRREPVSIGQSPRNTFVLPAAGLPRSLVLFDVHDGRYRLRFRSGLNGKLSIQGSVLDFRALREQKLARKLGDGYVVPLADRSWGKVVVDEITVLFQFVDAPAVPATPVLPRSMRQGWARFIDWPFMTALMGSFVVQVFSVVFIVSQDYPEPPRGIDALDDRFVSMLITETEPPEEKEEQPEEKADEKEKEKEKEKEPEPEKKKPEKKPEPKTPEEKAKRDAEQMRQMQETVRKKTILSVIGTEGGDGPAQFLDTLKDGATDVAIAEAFDGTSGVAIAGAADADGGRVVGQETGDVAGIDNDALAGPERKAVKTGSKKELDVRGSVAVKSPSESFGTGVLDQQAITKVVKRRMGSVKACYDKRLKRNNKLAGKVKMQFTILESGRVGDVQVVENTMGDPEVGKCISGRIKRWRFPKPDGGTRTVVYPFVFTPSG